MFHRQCMPHSPSAEAVSHIHIKIRAMYVDIHEAPFSSRSRMDGTSGSRLRGSLYPSPGCHQEALGGGMRAQRKTTFKVNLFWGMTKYQDKMLRRLRTFNCRRVVVVHETVVSSGSLTSPLFSLCICCVQSEALGVGAAAYWPALH